VTPIQNKGTTIPAIPSYIHKSIVENMEYWIDQRLWMYMERGIISLGQLGWDIKTQFRYCKRRDISVWVKVVAESVLETRLDWSENSDILLQTAAIMDEERGKDTVLNALQKFKMNSNLSWVKRRSRRKINNNE
jgi:hypothetical protein